MTRLFATAALGTADLVARELEALGFGRARWEAGGAWFEAGEDPVGAGMRACLHLRAALRVLWPLASFPVASADDLYAGAAAVPWERHLTPRTTFAVAAASAAPPPLAHAPYLALRVKDAVADRLRARCGARPDVRRDHPDVRVYLHLDAAGRAAVGLDVSGDSLHLRGYRGRGGAAAPLRETLAAAVLLASGWRGERPLLDPLCGSGTLVIEAALLAMRLAPGLLPGRRFGFERWPGFDAARWRGLRAEAEARVRPLAAPLAGSDRDPDVVAAARAAAARAGAPVRFEVADARALAPLAPPGILVANPPYGARLPGSRAFWRALGQRMRTLDGHTAFLLAPTEVLRDLGMRPTWERRLRNGALPVVLARYELGRRRANPEQSPRR